MAIRTIRLDSRRRTLILAIGLLLAAILVAGALLQQTSNTKVYLVANRDLPAGTAITAQDFREVQLSLGAEAGAYLSQLQPGKVLASSIISGELVPRRAILAMIAPTTKPVRVTPSDPLSARIRIGSLVQLWYAPKAVGVATTANAIQLLGDAEVLAIHRGELSMGRQIDDVEIAVPTESLSSVITAIASAGYVSVVSES
ncbi:MAG: SAF domain-containing protein [Micrococcales bacterium]